MKDLYLDDIDFGKVYKACENLTFDKFYKFDGYLFKEKNIICVNCSIHELLIYEAHGVV